MKLISIQVGKPRQHGVQNAADPLDRDWTSGIWKEPVKETVFVGTTNIEGDGQGDLTVHGGPEKAICAYPFEHYAHWQDELGIPAVAGGFGENFSTRDMLENDICIGDIFRIGTTLLQVSQPRQPCWKLGRRWRMKDLPLRVQETGKTGWYFRVLEEGRVTGGDHFRLEQRTEPAWTIAAANSLMHQRRTDWAAAAELAAHPGLSESWQATFSRRARKQTIEDSALRTDGE